MLLNPSYFQVKLDVFSLNSTFIKIDSVTGFENMFQANYEDTRITLNVSVLVTFLTSTLNMFLFAEVFSEAAVREFSRKYMVQLLYSINRKVKLRSYSSSQGHKNIFDEFTANFENVFVC